MQNETELDEKSDPNRRDHWTRRIIEWRPRNHRRKVGRDGMRVSQDWEKQKTLGENDVRRWTDI